MTGRRGSGRTLLRRARRLRSLGMTEPSPSFDPAALEEIISDDRNPWYSRGCAVGRFVVSLEPGDYRTRLVGYLEDSAIGHATIRRAVRETAGIDLSQDALRRHRQRSCSCPGDARS